MLKFIVGMAIGLAVAVLGGAVVLGWVPTTSRPAIVAKAPADAETVAQEAVASAVVASRVEGTPSQVEPDSAGAPPESAQGQEESAMVAAAASDLAPPAAFDPKELVKGLTLEQEKKLRRLVERRWSAAQSRKDRYNLGMLINELSQGKGQEDLKLSDVQRSQLDALRQSMRPRMDALLGHYWARGEEIEEALGTTGKEQGQVLMKERKELYLLNEKPIYAQLNDEFYAAARPILTPDQQQALNEMKKAAEERQKQMSTAPRP